MLTRLSAAAIAVTLSMTASVAAVSASDPDNVQLLATSIEAAGVTLYNACPPGVRFAGMYASTSRMLAVCADGARPAQFDAEQQDTLRHEGIHLAQDCIDRAFDGEMETTRSILDVMGLVAQAADVYDFERIENTYRMHGSDDMTILLEFEAWAGAAVLTNAEVAELVSKACGVN